MRNQKRTTMAITVCLIVAVSLIWPVDGFAQSALESVVIKCKPSKSKLLLGEPLDVGFEVANIGDTPVRVGVGGVDSGGLKIYISYNKGAYNEYFGRGWGRKRGGEATLEPGQSFSLGSPTILWNGKPNVSHLNEDAARQVLAGKITTEYAFQEPGIYFLKGRAYVGPDATPIESEPVPIEVIRPSGEDLEVWKQIEGNREIAFLMQNAELSTGDPYAKRQIVDQVERIVAIHSTSVYAEYLRTNLEKFKANEVRRNEAYKQK